MNITKTVSFQHNKPAMSIANSGYTDDDLYCAVDLLVILSSPASDPVQRRRAERWMLTEFYKLPAALRNKAIVMADVRVYQRGVV